jgi:hypothetical protein
MIKQDRGMEKGEAFELEVKQHLENELKQGDFGISPRQVKIFHRKAYFSKDRGTQIKVDISIEIFRTDAKEPYLIWVYECKNYNKSVPVDDIEEFHAKLEQLELHKTKGTVVSRNGFQDGAINYAKAKGISLIRLHEEFMIRMTEAARDISNTTIENEITESNSTQSIASFYGYVSTGEYVESLSDFIRAELRNI